MEPNIRNYSGVVKTEEYNVRNRRCLKRVTKGVINKEGIVYNVIYQRSQKRGNRRV